MNPPVPLEGGTFQGRYHVLRRIKARGTSALYEVVHLETRRRGALELTLPSTAVAVAPDLRGPFRLGGADGADVERGPLAETFAAGADPESGAPLLRMELLRGEDLASLLDTRGRLSPGEAVPLLFQAALELDKAHGSGTVHRDLEPESLFVAFRDDGSPHLEVIDVGITAVAARRSSAVQAARERGTPLYMAPEQIRGDGQIGPRADLYALGQIAYALLAGEPYWNEEALALEAVYPLLLRVNQGAAEPATARARRRSGVVLPASFDAWFAKATAVRETERPSRATAMIADLAVALGVAAPRDRTTTPLPPAPAGTPAAGPHARRAPSAARSRKPAILGAAVLLVAAASLLGMRWRHARDRGVQAAGVAPASVVATAVSAATGAPAATLAPTAGAGTGTEAAAPSPAPSAPTPGADSPATASSAAMPSAMTWRNHPSRRPGKAYDPLNDL